MPRPLTPSDTVLSMAACDQNTDRFIRKRVRAKGTRPTADISVADRDQTRADAFILQPRFLWARYYLPSRFRRQHLAHIGLGDPELSRYAGRCDSRLEGCSHRIDLASRQRDIGFFWLPPFGRFFRCCCCCCMIRGTLLCAHMGCRSNYRRTCERPAATLQLMAGSRKKPVQLPVVQLLERVGKVSRQHVSRWQFFGTAHGRSGLLGGCQACRSVSATRLLNACRLE